MMPRRTTYIRFATLLLVINILMAIYWQTTMPEKIYHCTDAIGFDYFMPGSWVHEEWEYVDDMVSTQKETNADTLLNGWSINRLWRHWLLMFGASVLLSCAITAVWQRRS